MRSSIRWSQHRKLMSGQSAISPAVCAAVVLLSSVRVGVAVFSEILCDLALVDLAFSIAVHRFSFSATTTAFAFWMSSAFSFLVLFCFGFVSASSTLQPLVNLLHKVESEIPNLSHQSAAHNVSPRNVIKWFVLLFRAFCLVVTNLTLFGSYPLSLSIRSICKPVSHP